MSSTCAVLVTGMMVPIYLIGLGRNFGYDESVTVGNFIATPSPLDALTRQIVNNNHPFLSFLDHLVFTATGSRDEVLMRLIPLAAALAALAILTLVCTRRLGVIAGLSAGAYLGSNPTFALWAQSVRGYSLLLLCIVVSSALITERRDATWRGLAYTVAVAVGVATNVFMVPVVGFHAAYLAARGGQWRRWPLRMLTGVVAGVGLALLPILHLATGYRGTLFYPAFPVSVFVLDFPGLAALAFAPLVVLGAYRYRPRRQVVAVVLAVAGLTAGLWLVVRPYDLYPRLFCWSLPLAAVAIALAVRAWRPAAILAMLGVASVLLTQYVGFGAPEEANRQVAAVIDEAHATGLRVCGLGDMLSFNAYTREYVETSVSNLASCDLAVAVWLPWSQPDDAAVRRTLPLEVVYQATNPISVYRR